MLLPPSEVHSTSEMRKLCTFYALLLQPLMVQMLFFQKTNFKGIYQQFMYFVSLKQNNLAYIWNKARINMTFRILIYSQATFNGIPI